MIAYSNYDNYGGGFLGPDGAYMIQGLPLDKYYIIAMVRGCIVELYDSVYSWEEATAVIPDAYGVDFVLAPVDSAAGYVSTSKLEY